MAIIPDPQMRVTYVLKRDREEPDGEVGSFTLRTLTLREWIKVNGLFLESSRAEDDLDRVTKGYEAAMFAVEAGVVDWHGHKNAEGKPVPFSKEARAMLGHSEVVELGTAVFTLGQIEPVEAKN